MSGGDIINMVFGGVGVLGMLAAAFMWIGTQKTLVQGLREEIKALREKVDAHDHMSTAIATITTELANIREHQPRLIATVVATAIRETLRRYHPA